MTTILTEPASARTALGALLHNYSFEMTAKDVPQLEEAADIIPRDTKIAITFLPNEDFPARVAAAARVRELGFVPVPHISARRVKSEAELEAFLAALQRDAAIDRAFVVAGDPPQPEGPYADALAVIRTGLLGKYGVSRVGISGYPEGHPEIGSEKLWQAKRDKQAAIADMGHDFAVVTQFGFVAKPILDWLEQLRRENVHGLVRVGVPGPASVKTLSAFRHTLRRWCVCQGDEQVWRLDHASADDGGTRRAHRGPCPRTRPRQARRSAPAFLSFRRPQDDRAVGK